MLNSCTVWETDVLGYDAIRWAVKSAGLGCECDTRVRRVQDPMKDRVQRRNARDNHDKRCTTE